MKGFLWVRGWKNWNLSYKCRDWFVLFCFLNGIEIYGGLCGCCVCYVGVMNVFDCIEFCEFVIGGDFVV